MLVKTHVSSLAAEEGLEINPADSSGSSFNHYCITTRKTQIKTSTRYHLTWLKWSSSESLHIRNERVHVEKREPSFIVGRNVNWCSHCGYVWRLLRKLKIRLLYDPAISFLGMLPSLSL